MSFYDPDQCFTLAARYKVATQLSHPFLKALEVLREEGLLSFIRTHEPLKPSGATIHILPPGSELGLFEDLKIFVPYNAGDVPAALPKIYSDMLSRVIQFLKERKGTDLDALGRAIARIELLPATQKFYHLIETTPRMGRSAAPTLAA